MKWGRGPLQMAQARTKTEIYLLFINCPRLDLFIRDMAGAGAAVSESPVRATRRKTPTRQCERVSPENGSILGGQSKVQIIIFCDISEALFFFTGLSENSMHFCWDIYCSFCLCNPLPIIFTSKHWRTHLKTNWFYDRVSKEKPSHFGAFFFSWLKLIKQCCNNKLIVIERFSKRFFIKDSWPEFSPPLRKQCIAFVI